MPTPTPAATSAPTGPTPNPTIIWVKPDAATLDAFNPLKIANSSSQVELSTPRGIISKGLSFIFPIAGMIMFVLLIVAGFEIMGGAATKKSIDAGKQRAAAAIIGFILLFISYWLARLLEAVFGITIFG